DQAKTKEAVEKFNDMIKAYPNSALRGEADKHLANALDRLAKHEEIIARFYMKRGDYNAAIQRLNFLVDNYPNYSERDAVFYYLGTALAGMGGRRKRGCTTSAS